MILAPCAGLVYLRRTAGNSSSKKSLRSVKFSKYCYQPMSIHTHTHIHTYIYIYICVCHTLAYWRLWETVVEKSALTWQPYTKLVAQRTTNILSKHWEMLVWTTGSQTLSQDTFTFLNYWGPQGAFSYDQLHLPIFSLLETKTKF